MVRHAPAQRRSAKPIPVSTSRFVTTPPRRTKRLTNGARPGHAPTGIVHVAAALSVLSLAIAVATVLLLSAIGEHAAARVLGFVLAATHAAVWKLGYSLGNMRGTASALDELEVRMRDSRELLERLENARLGDRAGARSGGLS